MCTDCEKKLATIEPYVYKKRNKNKINITNYLFCNTDMQIFNFLQYKLTDFEVL